MSINTHPYNSDHALHIPMDGRLWVGLLWIVSLFLLAFDSFDGHFGLVGAWGILTALAGTAWTNVVLHAYSRKVVLDVMSFEHRQQTPSIADPPTALSSL